ncbi:MAG TPA: DUF881 domain-containing protein [Sporichthya sp.]|nr:DUF881 domain-containing protein [Sporichthya sp.]
MTDPSTRRPDASMSLLSDLMANTLDEGYRREAQRRAAVEAVVGPEKAVGPGGTGRSGWQGATALVLVLGFAGLVLTVAAQQTHHNAPAVAQARNDLIDRVHAETERADELQRRLVALRADVDGARDDALAATSAGSAARADLERLSALAGVSPVRGPGIKVVVDDAPNGALRADGATGRVLDTDLQRLLNGLWAAGAEAVSVNGQRLTELTAVRSAGDAILVAYRPLSPPYEVLAIGNPDDLEVDFVDGPGGRWFHTLQGFGIRFTVTAENELRLPGASGVTLRNALAVQPQPSAQPTSSNSPRASVSPASSSPASASPNSASPTSGASTRATAGASPGPTGTGR